MHIAFFIGGDATVINISGKIRKIAKALEIKGVIYLYSRDQVYSEKLSKVCTLYKLDHLMPWEEFKKKFPDKAERKKKKGVPVRVEIIRTFKEIDVLMYLAEVLKAGDKDG